MFHPIDDCEHPLLYLPGTDIASQETALSGSCQQNLVAIRISKRKEGDNDSAWLFLSKRRSYGIDPQVGQSLDGHNFRGESMTVMRRVWQ